MEPRREILFNPGVAVIPEQASNGSNEILAALPPRERDSILQHSERVPLTPDEILGEPGERIRQVYFPLDGFIALLAGVDGREALAVGLVGSEGMLGAPLVLGVQTSPLRARVQAFGSALRIKAADFQRDLVRAPALERLLRRYLSVRLAQLAQTAACASFHVVDARLACWLLMAQDRAHGDRFYLTHDRLARLLGVRRSGVTTAAGVLQSRHLIRYTRGHIVVLDRAGLELLACGCQKPQREPAGAAAVATLDAGPAIAASNDVVLPLPLPPAPRQPARAFAMGASAPTPRRKNGSLSS